MPASRCRSTSRPTASTAATTRSRSSPRPSTRAPRRLWLENIVGDDGALGYLEGGAIPARFAALEASRQDHGRSLKKNLPPADVIAKVAFPTQAQTDAAKKILADNWGPMVADA